MTVTYSYVIPLYNEEDVLPELKRRLDLVLAQLGAEVEVIFIDDGSSDHSWRIAEEMHLSDARYKLLGFSRNFGHQAAITAGMDMASGEAVIVMDADLQDPPEISLEMVELWKQGFDVVYGVRSDRTSDTRFKRTSANWFYRALNSITNIAIPKDVGDFRLVDRAAVTAFKAFREDNRFVRGIYGWIGFKQASVTYSRDERFAGVTKYPLRKMLKLAGDGVIGFSMLPLKFALRIGMILSMLSLLAGALVLWARLFDRHLIPSWATIVIAVTFLGGLQLGFLGIIGHYMSRMYAETLRRPLYIVNRLRGVVAPTTSPDRVVITTSRISVVESSIVEKTSEEPILSKSHLERPISASPRTNDVRDQV